MTMGDTYTDEDRLREAKSEIRSCDIMIDFYEHEIRYAREKIEEVKKDKKRMKKWMQGLTRRG